MSRRLNRTSRPPKDDVLPTKRKRPDADRQGCPQISRSAPSISASPIRRTRIGSATTASPAEDGLNIFRHWFMWSAIEQQPGVYDWDEYDRQMDLAAENGIKTIIAELIHAVPGLGVAQIRACPAGQCRRHRSLLLNMGVSCRDRRLFQQWRRRRRADAELPGGEGSGRRFLTALATRYKGHPALLGYDVWNEVNYSADVDYCDYAKAAFREWLEKKYGDLETLARAWYRY